MIITNLYDAIVLETYLLDMYKKYKYIPKTKFRGIQNV